MYTINYVLKLKFDLSELDYVTQEAIDFFDYLIAHWYRETGRTPCGEGLSLEEIFSSLPNE